MNSRDLSRIMWSDALSLLDQAERLRRQFVRPAAGRVPTWEPPVDVIETTGHIRVSVALPGVAPESIEVTHDAGSVRVRAHRAFPLGQSAKSQGARIHALEIPHGRFERRITVPARSLVLTEQHLRDGCLTLVFSRKETS